MTTRDARDRTSEEARSGAIGAPTRGAGFGTPAPGEGYALTIAERECEKLTFEHPHDEHDVTVGVGIVAAKRASLIGRGPTLGDVHVALDYFGLRTTSPVSAHDDRALSRSRAQLRGPATFRRRRAGRES